MIPLATTTGTIRRPSIADDPYDDEATNSTVARGVHGHISSPSGRETRRSGRQETIDAVLDCDVADLQHGDLWLDEATGNTYEVVWVDHRVGLGLDHLVAGVRRAGAPV